MDSATGTCRRRTRAVDEVLNQQYQELLQNMTDFALGTDEPLSLLQQMGNTMFEHGYT